jgi:Ca2+-dependent lipid-binding protein
MNMGNIVIAKLKADRYEIRLTKVSLALAIIATVIFYLKISYVGFITAVILYITTTVLCFEMLRHHFAREVEWGEKQQLQAQSTLQR